MAETHVAGPKVTLYWLETSRAQRIVWLLEECKDLNYEIKTYKRTQAQLAPPELKKVHPLGKSPVISVESPATTAPLVIAESGFIAEYVSDHFAPHLIPQRYQTGKENQVGGETESWMRYRYYLHYAEGSLMSLLLIAYLLDSLSGRQVPFFIRPLTKAVASKVYSLYLTENLRTHFDFLESQLATSPDKGQYLCGPELTAADILMSFPLMMGKSRYKGTRYPKLNEYVERLEKHPSHVRANQKIEGLTGKPPRSML